MCNFALVGAAADVTELRSILGGPDSELDANSPRDRRLLACFPETDNVLCVTSQGCSCALLEGVGLSRGSRPSVHLAGPGYIFRRALAAAALRFGGIRLLAYRRGLGGEGAELLRHRTTTLQQFLRYGLASDDGIVSITA